jgi:peptidyl-prolyl cis-trans isomerase SurA
MVRPFENAYKKLTVGQLSEPVKTQYGWHIIEVLGTRSHDNTDKVKRNKAMESIRSRKTEPALQNWFRTLRDGSFIEVRL